MIQRKKNLPRMTKSLCFEPLEVFESETSVNQRKYWICWKWNYSSANKLWAELKQQIATNNMIRSENFEIRWYYKMK